MAPLEGVGTPDAYKTYGNIAEHDDDDDEMMIRVRVETRDVLKKKKEKKR